MPKKRRAVHSENTYHEPEKDYRKCLCLTCEALRELIAAGKVEARFQCGAWEFRVTQAGLQIVH